MASAIDGKTALVTGQAQASAEASNDSPEKGPRVIVADRDRTAADDTSMGIGSSAQSLLINISDEPSVAAGFPSSIGSTGGRMSLLPRQASYSSVRTQRLRTSTSTFRTRRSPRT
jgi:hypothetical protein